MIPIVLTAHTKPLTIIKFNDDGDLLFTGSDDNCIYVWNASNGSLLGVYKHSSAIGSFDISHDSRFLVSGDKSGDIYFWEISTGKVLHSFNVEGGRVQGLKLSNDNKKLAIIFYYLKQNCDNVKLYEVPYDVTKFTDISLEETLTFNNQNRPTTLSWSYLDQSIILGCTDGILRIMDPTTLELIKEISLHTGEIKSITFNYDQTLLLTCSIDSTANIVDPDTLEIIRTFKIDGHVNTGCFSPLFDHLLIGGGIDAKFVAGSHTSSSKFSIYFYNILSGTLFGEVGGHFGPVNSIAIRPDGKGFASGSVDGTVRLYYFDSDYYFRDEKEERELSRIIKKYENQHSNINV